MRIFLDSSVLLSACGSEKSLSRLIFVIAEERGWHLISAGYCQSETSRNMVKLGEKAVHLWLQMRTQVEWVPNALTSNKPPGGLH